MLRVCIASIENVERSLLLLVVSASDIPLRTIKFFFLLFSLRRKLIRPCCRPSQTNIRWCVADCAIYTAWSSVTVFGTSHVQQSSIASYWTRIAISAYTPPAFDAPVIGVPVGISHPVWYGNTRMVWLPDSEKISKICLFVLT